MSRILTVVSKHISQPFVAQSAANSTMVSKVASRVGVIANAQLVKPVSVNTRASALQFNNSEYAHLANLDSFELCAVPKKKISPHKRRLRQAGNWAKEAKRLYKPYQLCLLCNKPKTPQTICTKFKEQCMTAPRI